MNDKELIEKLGGATVVAKTLGYEGKKGVCRVLNWKRRGIPPKVRLEHLGYFMGPLMKAGTASRNENQNEGR